MLCLLYRFRRLSELLNLICSVNLAPQSTIQSIQSISIMIVAVECSSCCIDSLFYKERMSPFLYVS
jgi:hypothetical protein